MASRSFLRQIAALPFLAAASSVKWADRIIAE
jgi:hypothetical protein